MDRPFAGCRSYNRGSFPQNVLGGIYRSGNDSLVELANHGFHFGFVHFVAQSASLSLTISLFSGFMICHVGVPPVIIPSLSRDESSLFNTSVTVIAERRTDPE